MPAPYIPAPTPNIAVTQSDPDAPDATDRYDGFIAIDPTNPLHMVGICRKFYGPGINYQNLLEAQYSFNGGAT